MRVLSMGAGVQSTTLALMAIHGEIGPLPDCMIFANPGAETPATLRHLDWLEGEVIKRTNGRMRTERVSNGSITETIERRARGQSGVRKDGGSNRFVSAPFFTANGGMGRRQCTREFKVEPLTKMQRQLMGYTPRQRIPAGSCEVWIGISTDEVVRAGAAFDRWAVNRYPLLEMRMSRNDCEQWLRKNSYTVPPKSACVFCPYRSDHEWRWLKENDPDAFAEAIRIDALIRDTPGMIHAEYLHRSLKPLSHVDLSTAEDRGQSNMLMVCEAGCGL
ncbi:hypothetical protein FY050_02905 [Phyllobacterium endophyticum]|uniref:Phosphoadenosine phosphosulphate reductase domain-containing protein n=1 Tax=Phyllobacterium endophyticum TaxID=1149773 RepID=A0A2P7AX06_9HYPH|nr:hypothetical protein CU100_09555 [Phyllobacterium endophyticum]TYR44518.1 hypothetical protein FY050_02905 [Phyllobacterium endophyticum]